MRAGIYGRPEQQPVAAVAEGLAVLGYGPIWQGIKTWNPADAGDFDLVVTMGLRLHSGDAAAHYREQGVPVLVVDLPALRLDGYWALWPGETNRLPVSAPADRLGMVRLERKRRLGDWVLLCGQVPDDSAHGLDTDSLRRWFQMRSMLEREAGRKVIWRPHPQAPFDIVATDYSNPTDSSITEAILDPRVGSVSTYNSTCGIEALRLDVPADPHPSAFYAGVDHSNRADFFARLTYSQWTLEELASGEPISRLAGIELAEAV